MSFLGRGFNSPRLHHRKINHLQGKCIQPCARNFQHFAANTGFKRGDLRYLGVSRSPLDPLAGVLVSEDDRGPA